MDRCVAGKNKQKNVIDTELLKNFHWENNFAFFFSAYPLRCSIRLPCHRPVFRGDCTAGSYNRKRSVLNKQMQAESIKMTKSIRSITFGSNNVKMCFNGWILSFSSTDSTILEQRPGLSYSENIWCISLLFLFLSFVSSNMCTF